MRNLYTGAAPRRRSPGGPCSALWALLLLVATAGCSTDGATPQTPQSLPSPTAAVVPTATRAYSNSRIIEKYSQGIPQVIRENNIPGMSVAVVDDKEVLWAQGFGVTDPAQNRPVTADTLFSIQSMSKSFTAIAVLMAAQEGLVDLNAPISTYLPDFHVNSIFEEHPEQKMTLVNLLGQTAGFTHDPPVGNNVDIGPSTFEEHIKSISDTWLMSPVGQRYIYSNIGPDLAGYILQIRSGSPFAQYMQEKLLNPIGMTHSTFDMARIQQVEDRAIGHDNHVAKVPLVVPMIPAGGLYSNAVDMAKYLQFHINLGFVGNGKQLVPESLLDSLYAPPSPLTREQGVGYGVFVGRKHNTYYIGTGGGGFGFLSDLLWYPELKLGIVTLTNSADHDLQGNLNAQILDDLIADPDTVFHARAANLTGSTLAPWERVPGASTPPPPTPDVPALIRQRALPATPQDQARWAQYVGTYDLRVWGQALMTADLYQQDGRLYAKAQGNTAPLTEVRPGVFFADNGEAIDLRGPIPLIMGMRFTREAPGVRVGTPTGTP